MEHIYSSDRPVSELKDDRFQRYNFSLRIAETIKNRSSSEGLVIGLYGAWGEGKTSVLNFIENELKNIDAIITVKFNPWRYNDEDALIKGYFYQISKALGKELATKKEKVGTLLKKYGTVSELFGINISEIGSILSDVHLENLKDRVDEFLRESKSKLVIVVDDIDRLDKQELYSLFKLVKLTADFQNTVYILSFDEIMVASAIGERFGAGNSEAGRNFLEKIVQVPLQIPKAQISALKKYCFDLLYSVLEDTKLILEKTEQDNFIFQFSQNILLRIKTPRLAVRYANTLAFSIPLLQGEVNHSDLLLIEAIKIFYPNYYEFIKYNPHYFITSYHRNDSFLNGNIEKKKKELSENLELLSNDLLPQEKDAIYSLLKYLFPRLNEAFHNTFRHEASREYNMKRRIVSQEYFNRYFLYSIIDGELSDVLFDNFASSISGLDIPEIQTAIVNIVNTHSADLFVFKASTLEKTLDWETTVKFIYALTFLEDIFPQDNESVFSFGMRGSHTQLCILITQLLKNSNQSTNDILTLTIEIIKQSKTLDFALEIRRWFGIDKSGSDNFFSEDQQRQINIGIIEKALAVAGNVPIFEALENTYSILEIWSETDQNEINNYLNTIIQNNPEKSNELLYALTSTILSSTRPKPYKVDFNNDTYDFITKIIDKKLLHDSLIKIYGKEIEKGEVEFVDREDRQTRINILRQFEYWYKNDINLS